MNADASLSSQTKRIIENASQEGGIGVCAISLWEISMLSSKQRILLNQPCLQWIQKAIGTHGISLIPLTPEIAVETCSLPGEFHGDPADRMIVATARIFQLPLVTCDQKIIQYAQSGFLKHF